jgi:hypothetical protein
VKLRKLSLVVGFAVAAVGSIGASGVANATPMLQIVDGAGNPVPNVGPYPQAPVHAAFDAGPDGQMQIGTDEAPGSGGPGTFPYNIPTGTNGYAGDYLYLADSTSLVRVTFTMMGHGDATYNNMFQAFGWADASGSVAKTVTFTNNGTPALTTDFLWMTANDFMDFMFTANSTTPPPGTSNTGGNNCKPDLAGTCVRPFGLFDVNQVGDITQGTDFWLGFSDGGATPVDYDMQDMVIQAHVPEPGSIFLMGAGLLGLAGLRRRKA